MDDECDDRPQVLRTYPETAVTPVKKGALA